MAARPRAPSLRRAPVAPAQAWQQLRRQRVKQKVEVAMLPTAAFLDDGEIGDSDIKTTFSGETKGSLHKQSLPNQIEEGSFGFGQARRSNAGVFTIDFNEFAAVFGHT